MKSHLLKIYATLASAFVSFVSYADPFDPPAEDDLPAAPINTKLIWLAMIGIAFAFYYFNQKSKSKTKA